MADSWPVGRWSFPFLFQQNNSSSLLASLGIFVVKIVTSCVDCFRLFVQKSTLIQGLALNCHQSHKYGCYETALAKTLSTKVESFQTKETDKILSQPAATVGNNRWHTPHLAVAMTAQLFRAGQCLPSSLFFHCQ